MAMTSRERVLAAINHEEPDRVPIILGTSNATGLKMKPYRRLKALLGIEAEDRYIYDWPELGTAAPDERTLQSLRSDARGLLDRFPKDVYERNRKRPPHSPFIDDWGSGQVEVGPDEWFPGYHPMADVTNINVLDNYPNWPDMDDPTRISHLRASMKHLVEENQYALIGTPWLLFPLERAFALQGMDLFLMNMIERPDFAEALLRKTAELCKRLMGHFLRETGDHLDIIKIGDDLGMQNKLLISPNMYRNMVKPIHADFIAFIKERTNAKVFFHTDGDVFDLIDDFIEIGIDILNPIQSSAGKMSDLEALKKHHGNRIAFCGAIDTHKILPSGTPEAVGKEVRRVINLLGPGGGYLVSAVHTIMGDVPPENILAMVDAVDEFGWYPLDG